VRVVDVHNHFYPPRYMEALRSGDSNVTIKVDKDGNPEVHYPGDFNTAVLGHRDIAYRQGVLEAEGVDTQVISLTTPGTHVENGERSVRLARMVNDEFAEIVAERSPRFAALATLPLSDPKASVVEFRRAVEQLKMPGAMLFSNVNGIALADERYWPLYETANELGATLHIHPTNPHSVEQMRDYWLMPLVGFLFDTTIAAAHLVYRDLADRLPPIHWGLNPPRGPNRSGPGGGSWGSGSPPTSRSDRGSRIAGTAAVPSTRNRLNRGGIATSDAYR